MSVADNNVLPLCRKCKNVLHYRCTETVVSMGTRQELDVFECAECGRLTAYVRKITQL